jgi:hypothetical protein
VIKVYLESDLSDLEDDLGDKHSDLSDQGLSGE